MSTIAVDALTEFYSAIRSPVTKKKYEKRLEQFLSMMVVPGTSLREKANAFVERAKADSQWATFTILEYIRAQRERAERGEIAESTVPNLFKPIKLLLEENDVALNWRKIGRRIPKGRSHANDRLPNLDEVKAILDYPDRRIKPIVLAMVSSGIRVGAWDYLRWGDVAPIEREGRLAAAALTVYAGQPDEYKTFVTPEAYRALRGYIDFRAGHHEPIKPESPLMRDLWKGDRGGRGEEHIGVPLKSTRVKRLVEEAIKASGKREKLAPGKRRHEFQALHGFRKLFKSTCERKMKTLYVEMLMGHNTGLNENYLRLSEGELLNEYLRAVSDLTILEPKPTFEPEEITKKLADLEARMKRYEEHIQKVIKMTPEEYGRVLELGIRERQLEEQREADKAYDEENQRILSEEKP